MSGNAIYEGAGLFLAFVFFPMRINLIIAAAYLLMSRVFRTKSRFAPRTYRFAE